MKQEQCIFCKIAKKEISSPTLYEDEHIIAILDKFPSSLGHILVITKKHYKNIFEIDREVAEHVFPIAAMLAKAVKTVTHCEGINILQNNGSAAGQTVGHFHIHIIPRNDNDEVVITWDKTEPAEELSANFVEDIKSIISRELRYKK